MPFTKASVLSFLLITHRNRVTFAAEMKPANVSAT